MLQQMAIPVTLLLPNPSQLRFKWWLAQPDWNIIFFMCMLSSDGPEYGHACSAKTVLG